MTVDSHCAKTTLPWSPAPVPGLVPGMVRRGIEAKQQGMQSLARPLQLGLDSSRAQAFDQVKVHLLSSKFLKPLISAR